MSELDHLRPHVYIVCDCTCKGIRRGAHGLHTIGMQALNHIGLFQNALQGLIEF